MDNPVKVFGHAKNGGRANCQSDSETRPDLLQAYVQNCTEKKILTHMGRNRKVKPRKEDSTSEPKVKRPKFKNLKTDPDQKTIIIDQML